MVVLKDLCRLDDLNSAFGPGVHPLGSIVIALVCPLVCGLWSVVCL